MTKKIAECINKYTIPSEQLVTSISHHMTGPTASIMKELMSNIFDQLSNHEDNPLRLRLQLELTLVITSRQSNKNLTAMMMALIALCPEVVLLCWEVTTQH